MFHWIWFFLFVLGSPRILLPPRFILETFTFTHRKQCAAFLSSRKGVLEQNLDLISTDAFGICSCLRSSLPFFFLCLVRFYPSLPLFLSFFPNTIILQVVETSFLTSIQTDSISVQCSFVDIYQNDCPLSPPEPQPTKSLPPPLKHI